jgi:hypothetical protein
VLAEKIQLFVLNFKFPNMDDLEVLASAAAAASVIIAAIAVQENNRKRKKPCIWVKPIFQLRQQLGAYNLLMAELRSDDVQLYEGFTRISPQQFDCILYQTVSKPPFRFQTAFSPFLIIMAKYRQEQPLAIRAEFSGNRHNQADERRVNSIGPLIGCKLQFYCSLMNIFKHV